MLGKIVWESFSILLVLYGLYLTYIFIWFSFYRIGVFDLTMSKTVSGIVVLIILAVSSVKWFIKKQRELREKENQ